MEQNRKDKIYRTIMIIIITATVTFMITSIGMYNYYTKDNNGKIETLVKYVAISKEAEDIEKSIEIVKEKLENDYIGELDNEKMTEMAVKGYVAGLGDEYTEYLTKEEYEELLVSVTGDYVGIGIYMSQDNEGNIVVLLPMEDSPAEQAGIQSEDKIISIDGENCIGMDLNLAASKIKGEEGTTVKLGLLRGTETLNMEIERKKVEIKTSDSKVLDNNIGYIILTTFDEGCAERVENYLSEFQKQGVESVIIDLRNNTGGIVDEAINMSELFVPKGNIIMRLYNKNEEETIFKSKTSTKTDMNVILLVNEYSASATEIVTAAFKDNKIGTIIGTKTYGKGVMQTVEPLFEGALKITVQEFKTPNGNKINTEGIMPDIVVEDDSSTEIDEQLEKAIELLK